MSREMSRGAENAENAPKTNRKLAGGLRLRRKLSGQGSCLRPHRDTSVSAQDRSRFVPGKPFTSPAARMRSGRIYALELGLSDAFGDRFIEKLFHLASGLAGQFALLAA